MVALSAAEQQGQITLAELRACGLGPRAIAVRVRNGQLHRMYRGVYAVGHAGVTREGRWMAAVLACGSSAYLSWYAAGALLEYLPWEERIPDVTVVATKARRVEGINVHRARSLHWRDVTHHHGIPVTSPERTLLDLLVRGGIDRPEINAPLRIGGRTIIPDFLWRVQRLAIEADSERWHEHKLTRENDADKQAILEAGGWRVLRIDDQQLRRRPRQTLARIRAALAEADRNAAATP